MDTQAQWQKFYDIADSSPLQFVEGCCRLHLRLREWPKLSDPEIINRFLEKTKPEITFEDEETFVAERIAIIPRTSVNIQSLEGGSSHEQILRMTIDFPEALLEISIITSNHYPFHGVLGRFVAIIERKK